MNATDLTSAERETLEHVFAYLLLEEGGHPQISGKRLRASLDSMRVNSSAVETLIGRGWLMRQGETPNESYTLSGIGFSRGSNSRVFLRYGDAVLGFLKQRFSADPDFTTFTWDDLKSCIRIREGQLSDEQFYLVLHAIRAGRLFTGASGAVSQGQAHAHSWGVPRDIEQVVAESNFAARLQAISNPRERTNLNHEEVRKPFVRPRKAVVLTALTLERDAVLELLPSYRRRTHKLGTIYEVAHLQDGNWEVAVACVGMGNDTAAAETERAREFFDPDVLLFVGVAGGLKDVAIGDVVAGTKIYGFEYGKDARAFRPRPEVVRASYRLEQLARAESRPERWLPADETVDPYRIFVGPIAAGSKIVVDTNSPSAKLLQQNFSDAVAVEMEGLGFLSASRMGRSEALVIRGISDLLNDKEESDQAGGQQKAARNAANFALHLLAALDPSDHTTQEALGAVPTQKRRTPTRAHTRRPSDLEQGTTRFFEERLQRAFPGARGLARFSNAEARDRLALLLANLGPNPAPDSLPDPVWWFRGGLSSPIEHFENLPDGVSLLNHDEIKVAKVYAYRDAAHWKSFVYLEWEALQSVLSPPTTSEEIAEQSALLGYATEEFARWKGGIITRAEYDDGAAMVDGQAVLDITSAELRARHLSRFNVIVAGKYSPFNDGVPEVLVENLMNHILQGVTSVDELLELVAAMRRKHRSEL